MTSILKPAVELRDASFAYGNGGGNLEGITLRIEAGECVVFIGPSGGGKTTLTRIINGLVPEYYGGTLTGTVLINGERTEHVPLWKRASLMGNMFQDPQSQFFSDELAGEVAFACENLGFPVEEIRKRTNRAICDMKLGYMRHTPLDLLSSGEMQKVAIASLRAVSPEIFVFDEPSANLDEAASRQLADNMEMLKNQGHTLIVAEHRLSYLMEIADRFIYIKNGKLCAEYSPAELREIPPDKRRILGLRQVEKTIFPVLPLSQKRPDETPVVETVGLFYQQKQKKILNALSLTAYRGEITAITGLNGTGKTTFAKILCGLLREKRGRVFIHAKTLPPHKRRRFVWYGGNNTNPQFFTNTVMNELMLLHEGDKTRGEKALSLLEGFGLHEHLHRHPAVLSGGQKQRLSIILGLLSGRDLLIFDEPTSGLDGENLYRVATALRAAAEPGPAVFVITHDTELTAACCDYCFNIEKPDLKQGNQ
jgi:energy-coupling factor transport system ATP-binding protein